MRAMVALAMTRKRPEEISGLKGFEKIRAGHSASSILRECLSVRVTENEYYLISRALYGGKPKRERPGSLLAFYRRRGGYPF